MISESDIWRSAALLIEQHGRDALNVAGGRAIEMHEAGDKAGEALWCKILDAIQELRRLKRDASETEQ